MRYCHISNHPYDYDKERDGCSCTAKWDDYEPSPVPLIGIVPGGAGPVRSCRLAGSSRFRWHRRVRGCLHAEGRRSTIRASAIV